MKLIPIPKRKRSIRAVDQGTVYDVTGKLRKLTRAIERGEHGDVRDIVILLATPANGRNSGSIESYHFGKAGTGEVHWMVSTIKNRLEPA